MPLFIQGLAPPPDFTARRIFSELEEQKDQSSSGLESWTNFQSEPEPAASDTLPDPEADREPQPEPDGESDPEADREQELEPDGESDPEADKTRCSSSGETSPGSSSASSAAWPNWLHIRDGGIMVCHCSSSHSVKMWSHL